MLDLRRLRLLRELDARGTVHGAARALDYTPSAISQQLAVLEREAGVALLERSGRNVRLTEAGQVLVRHAASLLDGVEAAEAELADVAAGRVAGVVRVAAFQSAFLRIVAPADRRARRDASRRPRRGGRARGRGGGRPRCGCASSTWSSATSTRASRAPSTPTSSASALLREQVWLVLPEGHPEARARARADARGSRRRAGAPASRAPATARCRSAPAASWAASSRTCVTRPTTS